MTTPSANSESDVFHHHNHDHSVCVDDALAEARRLCSERSANLTPLRQRVLQIVWSGHRPLGAYDILAALNTDGKRAAPPTVYRALEFLLEHGLVHRLASLNAYAGCTNPGHGGQGQFLLCTQCGHAAELVDGEVSAAIESAARRRDFQVSTHTVEIAGTCPNCIASQSS
ncbi:MAG: Fur family transcriptional regulator [Pseudomonadota bacterium]